MLKSRGIPLSQDSPSDSYPSHSAKNYLPFDTFHLFLIPASLVHSSVWPSSHSPRKGVSHGADYHFKLAY